MSMREVSATLRKQGMSTFVKWDWIFCAPPLTVNEKQIQEGPAMLDEALAADDLYFQT